ncbi:unnamed protein product [[Candida] boidinii]|uniref:Unnamed protein product n=1 Tax=Candida boidinii TaxID=5477 RepID=A0ACB5U5T4_CANBO|nr:unnamed protein product [[Candida] boidinii]
MLEFGPFTNSTSENDHNKSENANTNANVSSSNKEKDKDDLIYKMTSSIKIGGSRRFIITYIPDNPNSIDTFGSDSFFVKIKNKEMLPLRAAYLAGPFVLYCDIRTSDYNHNKNCFITADQPVYEPNLNAGQSLVSELAMNTIKDKYVWYIDIQSQMLFSTTAEIQFELIISNKKKLLDHHHHLLSIKDDSKIDSEDENSIIIDRNDSNDSNLNNNTSRSSNDSQSDSNTEDSNKKRNTKRNKI